MDALSEALTSVRITGAIFFDAICTAPWGFAVPRMQDYAHMLAPGTECLVGYHLLAEGRAAFSFQGEPAIELTAGDVVIIPHGDQHVVSHGRPAALTNSAEAVQRNLGGEFRTYRVGGGGEVTRFVCGYFGCERHAARLFLAGLPRAVKVRVRDGDPGAWLESSILHLLSETASGRPGWSALLSRMAEALFIESLRRHMETLPPEQTGWLAGSRDPVVGATLALIHRDPCRAWTLTELARQVGAARSVLAERFARFLGEPPMTYLARWRLQLAARLLQTTRKSVIEVAFDTGYASEAAFSRAFKREFSLPPGAYRRQAEMPLDRAS